MCVPDTRAWVLRMRWLEAFVTTALVLMVSLLLAPQNCELEWRIEVVEEGYQFGHASWNLTLPSGWFEESSLGGSVTFPLCDASMPKMPPPLHLTSGLLGGSPKKTHDAKQKKTPIQDGLCKSSPCKTQAQSGHGGYCKACYKKRFPEAYAEKTQSRKRKCAVCVSNKGVTYTVA